MTRSPHQAAERAIDPHAGSTWDGFAALQRTGRLDTAAGLRLRLAPAYGFCPGVARAARLALEAAPRSAAPGEDQGRGSARGTVPSGRTYLAGELIHNPAFGRRLEAGGLQTLPAEGGPRRFERVGPQDQVIVPAFGLPVEEIGALEAAGCRIIDATCGWVVRVWRAIEEFGARGLTTVLHGTPGHDEVRAALSRATGPYLVLRTLEEARGLARVIQEPNAWDAFAAGFSEGEDDQLSPGFDPPRHLRRLGLVNQTTMRWGETEQIGFLLRDGLAARLGRPPTEEELSILDTLCLATQERQDAVTELVGREGLDAMIVAGGFHSSNTAQLARLAAERVPTYHIETAADLIDPARIRHRPVRASGAGDSHASPVLTQAWQPPLPATIGLTAGASTPDEEIARVAGRLLELYGQAPIAAPEGNDR